MCATGENISPAFVCTVQTSSNLNGTHEQNATKTRVTYVYTQKSNFACACMCYH